MTPSSRWFPSVVRRPIKRNPLRLDGLEDRLAPAGLSVALISNAVAQADAVAAAAREGVIVQVYDADRTDTAGLADLLARTSAANGGAPIDHLALVAHGSAGRVAVGGGDVWGTPGWNADLAWDQLRALLAPDAVLDLYSCSSAAGRAGRVLIEDLAAVTGAAVRASDDPVGSGPGADFTWEESTGRTPDLFGAAQLEAIQGLRLDDNWEPNDTRAEVDAAAVGAENSPNFGTVTAEKVILGLALQDAADWYKFATTTTGTSNDYVSVAFAATGGPGVGDLDLEILASDGLTVLRSDYHGSALLAFTALNSLPAGTYYARVFDNTGYANPNYTLTLDPPGDEPDDDSEANDTRIEVDAAPVGVGNSPNLGTLTAERVFLDRKLEDAADWYKFATTTTGTSNDYVSVAFAATGGPGVGDLDLEILASDGLTVLRSDYHGIALLAFTALNSLPAGTYYARVFDNTGYANPNYTLTFDPPGDEPDDEYEANDDRLVVDARIPGELNSPNLGLLGSLRQFPGLRMEDAADWYRFEIAGGATSENYVSVAFAATGGPGVGDLDLEILASDGLTILRSDYHGSALLAFTALNSLPAGTYYARVFDNTGYANPNYTLTINPPPGASALSLAVAPGTVPETAGPNAATGTVTRATATTEAQVVSLYSSQPGTVIVPPTVTIPANQLSASFPVGVVNDLTGTGTRVVGLTATAAGFAAGATSLSVTDDDTVTILPSGSTAVAEGGTADTYTIVLSAPPTANVTVTLDTGTQVSASPAVLVFTPSNWATGQTVTLTAVDDAFREPTQTVSVTHSAASSDARYNGIPINPVAVTVMDNDQAGAQFVQSGGSTAVSEAGGTDAYTVRLTSRPTAAVTVQLAASSQLNVSPASLTFDGTNWNVFQTVTVSATDDPVGEGVQLVPVTHSVTSTDADYNGVAASSVVVSIADNDTAPAIRVTPTGGSTEVTEGGGADTYTVVLDTQPTDNVTVTLAHNGQIATDPAVLTFTPADWSMPKTVTVSAVNDLVVEATGVVAITHTATSTDVNYNAYPVPGVLVTIADNDIEVRAATDVVGVPEDAPATAVPVLGNDSGAGILIAGVTQGTSGTVVITGGGTSLTYQPGPNFTGSDTFTYTIADINGTTATGGVLVNVTAVNDAPTLTLPGPQTVRANTPVTIGGLLVSDPDILQESSPIQVSLSVGRGTLTLPTAGLTFTTGDGTADTAVTFTGSRANVTTALAGLTYAADRDTLSADVLTVDVSDLGFAGSGGPLTASGTVPLNPVTNVRVLQPNPFVAGQQDLVLYGTAAGETITVTGSGTTYKVKIGATLFPTFTGVTGRILVFGLGGDDNLDASKAGRAVVLNGGDGNDNLFGGSKADRLTGGPGDDLLSGGKGADRLVEAGDVNFILVQGTKTTPGSLTGLGTDQFVTNSVEEADLTGGPGANTLDATAFVGRATLSGGAGNDTLKAGVTGAVLLGGAGDDTLIGNAGRDILIGGLGLDSITGGAGEDILTGGTTAFDTDRTALSAVTAEWSGTKKYTDRVARLQGIKAGGLNKTTLLTTETVTADGVTDVLRGEAGLDWFLLDPGVDDVTLEAGESPLDLG